MPVHIHRRVLVPLLGGLAGATILIGGASYAQTTPTAKAAAPTAAAPASVRASRPAPATAPGHTLAGVRQALENLVADGTITQAQAGAVQHQADAGSIDPTALVQAGTLTQAQMRTVGNSLDHLKQS